VVLTAKRETTLRSPKNLVMPGGEGGRGKGSMVRKKVKGGETTTKKKEKRRKKTLTLELFSNDTELR